MTAFSVSLRQTSKRTWVFKCANRQFLNLFFHRSFFRQSNIETISLENIESWLFLNIFLAFRVLLIDRWENWLCYVCFGITLDWKTFLSSFDVKLGLVDVKSVFLTVEHDFTWFLKQELLSRCVRWATLGFNTCPWCLVLNCGYWRILLWSGHSPVKTLDYWILRPSHILYFLQAFSPVTQLFHVISDQTNDSKSLVNWYWNLFCRFY